VVTLSRNNGLFIQYGNDNITALLGTDLALGEMDNEEAQRRTEEQRRDRTMLCDGKVEIASEKGRGTTVHISLPCDAETIGGPA
jgi:hypothetical protein